LQCVAFLIQVVIDLQRASTASVAMKESEGRSKAGKERKRARRSISLGK
jgi:hypothetical protein